MRHLDISEVKANSRDHFFSPDTMRFFNSRPENTAYRTDNGLLTTFVDSIKRDRQHARIYKVRVMLPDGTVWPTSYDVPSAAVGRKVAKDIVNTYETLMHNGAALIEVDMRHGYMLVWYGHDSMTIHVHEFSGGEVAAFGVDSDGPLTPEEAGDAMRQRTYSGYTDLGL
jgi:hypothetical protein